MHYEVMHYENVNCTDMYIRKPHRVCQAYHIIRLAISPISIRETVMYPRTVRPLWIIVRLGSIRRAGYTLHSILRQASYGLSRYYVPERYFRDKLPSDQDMSTFQKFWHHNCVNKCLSMICVVIFSSNYSPNKKMTLLLLNFSTTIAHLGNKPKQIENASTNSLIHFLRK